MINLLQKMILLIIYYFSLPLFIILPIIRRLIIKRKRPNLLWGPIPILSNMYWSESLEEKGYHSKTLMYSFYSKINKKEDYDLYINQFGIGPEWLKNLDPIIRILFSFTYSIFKYDIFHIPCTGHILGFTPLKWLEPYILKLAGIKTIVLPYGSDFYMYSKIRDPNLIIGLNYSYPKAALIEQKIEKDVNRWVKNADSFLPCCQIDGIGRIDIIQQSYLSINISDWKNKVQYSTNNGSNGVVQIAHTPNHRGVKGTEYIIKAVDELKEEGLKLELLLIEGKQNFEVKDILLNKADILVEKIVGFGYALSGIEGMATGLPTISHTDNIFYSIIFNGYSYLKECPIHSANVDNIKDRLRELVVNPELREELGRKGRKYVEKYHSYFASAYFFDQIYQKIWYGKDIDLMNMYHPLNPDSYNNIYEKIKPKDV